MNYEVKLKELKDNIDKAKDLKNRAEGQLDQLKTQEKQYLEELEKLGVDPKNLEAEIANLKREIEDMLEKADSMIPKDILNRTN